MAEGWARVLRSEEMEAYSAGTHPQGLNPLAVRAMAEAGVDISGQASKRPEDIGVRFDYVVTVCDSAHGACPVLGAGTRVVHAGFDDPPRLAAHAPSDEEAMPHYRRVRDEIRAFVETLPGALGSPSTPNPEQPFPPRRTDHHHHHHPPTAFTVRSSTGFPNTSNELESPMNSASRPNDRNDKTDCCGPSCCGGGEASKAGAANGPSAEEIRSAVREGYAQIARSGSWSASRAEGSAGEASPGCCGTAAGSGGGCCGPSVFTPDQLARAIGYSQSELDAIPESANMGLSCGNPTALASLRPGERVLDLGSGGGFDCFIAGAKVGAAGRVYGVDMTPEMVAKARANAAAYTEQTGLSNVEFRSGEIENIPLDDGSVDVVISNCVLNLSPDQPRVWQEISRVLRPGGRVAISDLVLLRALPASVRADVEALIGCVAGASLGSVIEGYARRAGLKDILVQRRGEYVDAMTDWQDPLYKTIIARLGPGERIGTYVTSAEITARKPG